ncbi:MAG TPA: hypothetical protein VFV37_07980, partial [Luteibaculaceae bacterium]|nr:hypothetical protein [Luteibaculaceae bacterium]
PPAQMVLDNNPGEYVVATFYNQTLIPNRVRVFLWSKLVIPFYSHNNPVRTRVAAFDNKTLILHRIRVFYTLF